MITLQYSGNERSDYYLCACACKRLCVFVFTTEEFKGLFKGNFLEVRFKLGLI